MERNNKNFGSRMRWILSIIRHGLFWHGVRNNLAKIGLDFMPYYWCKADINESVSNDIKKIDPKFTLSNFSKPEILKVKSAIKGLESKDLLADIKNGDICLGLKVNSEIVAYTFIRRIPFTFRKRYFNLGNKDCYMHSMYVFEKFRGNKISPYLRYECLKAMKDIGITNHYSLVEYFNKPAINVQKKINAKPVALYLSVIMFKKWTMNFKLKSY